MNKNTSLSSRLITYWIVGSILAFFTIPATVYLPLTALKIGEYANTNLEGWTTKRARDLVVDALREDARAGKYVKHTDALRTHMARNPEFRFAVFDAGTGSLLAGSSSDLASHFDGKSDVEVVGSMFHLANDPNVAARGYYRTVDTPIGRVRVIVYGAHFHWDDILYQLYNYLTLTNFLAYLPLCSVMSVAAFIVVRRGLAPLRSVAARVASIDVNSLDQRISRTTLPAELLPFVDAVNSAFDRVHEGVARQKRFTANAAHELRTPIAILRARVDKLQEKPLKHEIERDVRRIQSIVEQLLVLAQVREKDVAPSTTINLNEIALSVGADFMPIAIDNQRSIALESPRCAVLVRGYRWAVESVVTNLVENAVRAEPIEGTVVVRIRSEGLVEIIDHGDGVAATDREKIFEPFWRKSETEPGTGLGLAIAKELTEAMRGRIWVEDTPGGGATFKLWFPGVETA